ncbi:MAG: hypothetical protein RXN95_01170 [Hydrogenobaculum sp.]|jgi:hypothetical protein
MNINKVLLIMDMESGNCQSSTGKIIDFLNIFKAEVDALVVLESVKKAEDIALSFGMPFDPKMKEDSVNRALDKLKHMFPKELNIKFHVKVGDFEEEAKALYNSINPDMLIVACNNFNKNISKFSKSVGKPVLLIN